VKIQRLFAIGVGLVVVSNVAACTAEVGTTGSSTSASVPPAEENAGEATYTVTEVHLDPSGQNTERVAHLNRAQMAALMEKRARAMAASAEESNAPTSAPLAGETAADTTAAVPTGGETTGTTAEAITLGDSFCAFPSDILLFADYADACPINVTDGVICFTGHGTANLNAYCSISYPGPCPAGYSWADLTKSYYPGTNSGYFEGVVCGFHCSYIYEYFKANQGCTWAGPAAQSSTWLHLN
jgi:hypothetical protein